MLKMKFWFEGNQLQPDCNIHGGCKIGSSACHACPHCVKVNSKDKEVLCLGDGSEYKEVKLDELKVGDTFKTVKNVYGTLYTVREIKNGKILVDSIDSGKGVRYSTSGSGLCMEGCDESRVMACYIPLDVSNRGVHHQHGIMLSLIIFSLY